jgi:cytochrome P450
MAYWSKYGPAGFNTTTHDWTIVTLNILATAAFGESWDFLGLEEHKPEAVDQLKSKTVSDMEMSSRESIAILASSVRLLTLTPRWFFSVPPSFMPTKSLQQFVAAHTQFEQCMKEMVAKKRAEIASGEIVNDATFLSTLILKSTEAQQEKLSLGPSGGGLSEDEIYGNLFFYHIAGHETTAGVLGYAVYLLAAFPKWQRWVHEEIDATYKPHIDVDKMDYKETSPKLKRCLAVMVCSHFPCSKQFLLT